MTPAKYKTAAELFDLPEPPKTGRERLVAAAVNLFYRHGYAAVGIDQVVASAGVTKTTFYKHFESKDDLMVAAVERQNEWESYAWGRAIQKIAGDDPVKKLLAMFDVMDLWFNGPDFNGCLFLNTTMEFPNPNDPVHQAAAAFRKKNYDYRRSLAIAAGADAANADAFADCYTALVEGALILRQAHGRNDAARSVKPAVQKLIDAYLGRTASPPRKKRVKDPVG